MGGAHGGVSSAQMMNSCLDSIAVAVSLEVEEGAGAGLWLTLAEVRRNVPSMLSAPQPVGNQRPRGCSKLMIGLIGRVVATVKAGGGFPYATVPSNIQYLRS